MADASASSSPQRPVHLVVLQHGLWGNTTCVSNLEKFLRQHLGQHESTHRSTAAAGDKGQVATAAGSAADGSGGKTASDEAATARAAAADSAHAGQLDEAEVQILNSDVNRKALTYDGIDVCGARVVKMILDCIQLLQSQGRQVTKLSFVGYSLGGLILRYAVGKLYVLGLFEEVECANFITIATPHLGSWRSPTSFWARFFNSHVAVVGSRTGRQLMLADSDYSVPWLTHQQELHEQAHAQHISNSGQATPAQQQGVQSQKRDTQPQQQQQAELPPGVKSGRAVPLLLLMAHPSGPFHKALLGFKTRMVAANILYDAMVPYCTASLCMINPYEERLAVSIDPKRYPSVVRPAAIGEEVTNKLTYKGRTKRLFLFALFSPLAPLLYAWTVAYGILHHRSARTKALEGSWLQQQSPAAAGAAGAKALHPSLSSSRSAKQLSLLPGGARTAATLAGSTAPAVAGAADANGAGTAESEQLGSAAEAAADRGLSDGLISTAVEPAGEGCGVSDAGAERSPLEKAMQQVAAATADAEVPSALDTPSAPAAAAAEGQPGIAAGFSRRRSDSLAAVVAHHQQEDELGHFSMQLNSKDSVKTGLASLSFKRSTAAEAAADVSGTAAAAAVGAESKPEGVSGGQKAKGGKERVSVDRDGIVEAPHLLHRQQAWMAQQLFDNMPPCSVPDNSSRFACSSSSGSSGSSGSGGSGSSGSGSNGKSAANSANSNGSAMIVKKGGWTSDEQQQQQQDSLSSGGWHRVDVCTRHWHAHAAIIIRDYRFKAQSKDMFQYLVDHMSL